MAKKNPNIRPILQLVAKHNGDPKAAFYALAEEKGVNPDDWKMCIAEIYNDRVSDVKAMHAFYGKVNTNSFVKG